MSHQSGSFPRILRAEDHPSTPETVAEITSSLRDLPNLRFIAFGRSPGPESPMMLARSSMLAFAVPSMIIAIAMTMKMGFPLEEPRTWLIYVTMIAGVLAALMWVTLLFHHFKRRRADDLDERVKAVGIAEDTLHLVHLHDDAIARTTCLINRRRSIARYADGAEISYVVPYGDSSSVLLSRLPLDPELDALMMRDADQWTTRQPRIRAEAAPAA